MLPENPGCLDLKVSLLDRELHEVESAKGADAGEIVPELLDASELWCVHDRHDISRAYGSSR